MSTLAHPFRVDANGAVVTLEQGSARHAAFLFVDLTRPLPLTLGGN